MPEQLSTRVEGETVILHLTSGRYYGLRGTGPRVWELIADGTTVNVIVATLLQEYDVDPDRCRDDVARLVDELAGSGLVELRDVGEG